MTITRKEFLKSLALAGAAAAVSSEGALEVLAQSGTSAAGKPFDMVAVMGGEPEDLFNAAINKMGGISRFVKPGQKVVIKPNIGWDKTPEMASNTNPQLIVAIIKACRKAGAAEVTVFDHTCDEWRSCYTSSGIEPAALKVGAKVVPANEESYYREISLPRAKNLKRVKVHQAILDCDVWINVPVLKNHGGAKMTLAMKNHMGIVWDRRFFHTHDLQQCIADICTIDNPAVLNIIDAYRIMKTNGPRGRSLNDVENPKMLFMSTDIVAVDTAATKFFNQFIDMPLDVVGHLRAGQELGVGTMNVNSLNVGRVKL